jgi:hypothetical protein
VVVVVADKETTELVVATESLVVVVEEPLSLYAIWAAGMNGVERGSKRDPGAGAAGEETGRRQNLRSMVWPQGEVRRWWLLPRVEERRASK